MTPEHSALAPTFPLISGSFCFRILLSRIFYFILFYFILFYFILFERDSESGGGAERGRERISSSLRAANTEADAGLKLMKQ